MKINKLYETKNSVIKTLVHNRSITTNRDSQESWEGVFSCINCKVNSLEGCPIEVFGDFYCGDNPLSSLEGCPKIVHGDFNCGDTNITNFKDIHKHLNVLYGSFSCLNGAKLKSHFLGLLLIKELKVVYFTLQYTKRIKRNRKNHQQIPKTTNVKATHD
jgi:hypothetical protein